MSPAKYCFVHYLRHIYIFSVVTWISRDISWNTSSDFVAAIYCCHLLWFKNDTAPVFSKFSSNFPNKMYFLLFILGFIIGICINLYYLNHQDYYGFWFFHKDVGDLKKLYCFVTLFEQVQRYFFPRSYQSNSHNTNFYFAVIQF